MVFVFGCYSGKELQADIINAELVKIDTVYRHPSNREQLLTWKTDDNLQYVSYASMDQVFVVGSKIMMLVRK